MPKRPSGMKIVVIGGSGLIGTKLVAKLRQLGHEVVAASPGSGVNTVAGEGLAEALAGARVVVDLANSPSFEDKAAMEFFERSGRNLLAAEAAASVTHHVALSVVGTDRLLEMGCGIKVNDQSLIPGDIRASARRVSTTGSADPCEKAKPARRSTSGGSRTSVGQGATSWLGTGVSQPDRTVPTQL